MVLNVKLINGIPKKKKFKYIFNSRTILEAESCKLMIQGLIYQHQAVSVLLSRSNVCNL